MTTNNQIIGQAVVFLDILEDQYKHDEWFNLDDKGVQTGKIRINLHWIHSRRKFLLDILKIQDLAIEEETNDKELLELQLQHMKKPFGFMTAYYK